MWCTKKTKNKIQIQFYTSIRWSQVAMDLLHEKAQPVITSAVPVVAVQAKSEKQLIS